MEVAAPLKNDPILSGRSILSFRHLELQNPSVISDLDTARKKVRRRNRRSSRRKALI